MSHQPCLSPEQPASLLLATPFFSRHHAAHAAAPLQREGKGVRCAAHVVEGGVVRRLVEGVQPVDDMVGLGLECKDAEPATLATRVK